MKLKRQNACGKRYPWVEFVMRDCLRLTFSYPLDKIFLLDSTQNSSATNQSHSPKAKTTDDESLIDLFPVDNSLQSALSWNPRFSARFTQNYTKWLEDEVYNNRFDWDGLLDNIKGIYITS